MYAIAAQLLTSWIIHQPPLLVTSPTQFIPSPPDNSPHSSVSPLLHSSTSDNAILVHKSIEADFSDAVSLVHQLSGSNYLISVVQQLLQTQLHFLPIWCTVNSVLLSVHVPDYENIMHKTLFVWDYVNHKQDRKDAVLCFANGTEHVGILQCIFAYYR